MKNDVFISYSKNDKATADAICRALETHQLSCWYAPRNIPTGADWDTSIMEALANSRVMILVWSAKSDKSKQVKREVAIALDDVGITLIPFRVEEIVSSKLRYYLGNIQWLDASATSLEDNLQRLVEQVKAFLPQDIDSDGPIEEQLQSAAAASGERKDEMTLDHAAEVEQVRDAAKAEMPAEGKSADEAERQQRQEEQDRAEKLERQVAEETRQRAEREARQRQEAEARQREEAEARKREEAEARQREEAETRNREEAKARQREEAEARKREEAEARQREEAEVRQREEAEARQREETEALHDAEIQAARTAVEVEKQGEGPKIRTFPLRRVAIPVVAFLMAVAGLAYAFWPDKHEEQIQPSTEVVANNQTPTPEMPRSSPSATTENKGGPSPAKPTPSPRKVPSPERSPHEITTPPAKPSPTQAPPVQPSPIQPVATVKRGLLNGKAIDLPEPLYPPIARQAHASGTVVVQVTIDEYGNVTSARAVSGHPLLQGTSVAAARGAKFSPTFVDGQPVKVTGLITYHFIAQ